MAAWSRNMLKMFDKFLCFFEKKRPLTVKFSKKKFCSVSFSSLHQSTSCSNYFVILWNLADGISCIAYLTKKNKILPGSAAVTNARIAPKMFQGQPWQCTQSAPVFIQIGLIAIGGVIAERVNIAKTRRKVNPIFGWSLASSRIIA